MTVILDPRNFQHEVLDSPLPTLVKFEADRCPACRAMERPWQELEATATAVKLCRVDVDAHPELAETYGVRSIPTFLLFCNGDRVTSQTGACSLHRLKLMAGYCDPQT